MRHVSVETSSCGSSVLTAHCSLSLPRTKWYLMSLRFDRPRRSVLVASIEMAP